MLVLNPIKLLLSSAFLLTLFVQLSSCKNDPPDGIDAQMYEMGRNTAGFIWYKNSSAQLSSSGLTGHSEPTQRTRYNMTASSVLTSEFKIMEGAVFPTGSLVVKELYKSNGNLSTLAMLYKKPDAAEADADGWVWGYFDEKGDVRVAASDKGSQCRSCHSQAGAIDFNLMNLAHP